MNSIGPRYLVDKNFVSLTKRMLESDDSIDIYLHDFSGSTFVYGGVFGSQYIQALSWEEADLAFARDVVLSLDNQLDINVRLAYSELESDIAIYLDESISLEGSSDTLGIALSNFTESRGYFWEIFLDRDRFGSDDYFRYGLIHELGHTFGLEHPFSSGDGDLYASNEDPWSSTFPEETVMSYRRPMYGAWPNEFSENDWNALQSVWGVGGSQIDTFVIGKEYELPHVRDYDGILHGGFLSNVSSFYMYQGRVDINSNGSDEFIYTNKESGRWVTVGSDLDFSDYGQGGETRVVGLYDDPLVLAGEVIEGSPHDSQVRFQNDLYDDNLRLGSAEDVDGDGFGEVFWETTDGSAFLRSIHHLDGNVKYANYMNAWQMTDYLSRHGHMGDIGSSLGL